MARISYYEPDLAATETQNFLSKLAPLNIFRMLARAPGLLRPFVKFGSAFLDHGQLDPVLRECAILRVGYISGASYETAQHEKIGRSLGMTEQLFAALRSGPSADDLTEEQSVVISFVDDLVANVRAQSSTFQPVLHKLGAPQTQELVLLTGYYMMVCRFLETFDVDIEEGGPLGLSL